MRRLRQTTAAHAARTFIRRARRAATATRHRVGTWFEVGAGTFEPHWIARVRTAVPSPGMA